jgi:hypothetical protein
VDDSSAVLDFGLHRSAGDKLHHITVTARDTALSTSTYNSNSYSSLQTNLLPVPVGNFSAQVLFKIIQ